MPTIHIHADESGDLRFDGGGSRYFVCAAAWTYEPVALADRLRALRFSLLRDGENLERFHASDDRAWCREKVIEALTAEDRWRFAALVVDKERIYHHLRDPLKFYPRFLPMVLAFVLQGRLAPGTDRVLIYTDRIPVQRRRRAVEKAIQRSCKQALDDGIAFRMYHHASASNNWLQVADYCSWTVYRKYSADDRSYYDRWRRHMASSELYLWP